MRSLPIYEHLSELTEAIWSEDRALVQALPGAGRRPVSRLHFARLCRREADKNLRRSATTGGS